MKLCKIFLEFAIICVVFAILDLLKIIILIKRNNTSLANLILYFFVYLGPLYQYSIKGLRYILVNLHPRIQTFGLYA